MAEIVGFQRVLQLAKTGVVVVEVAVQVLVGEEDDFGGQEILGSVHEVGVLAERGTGELDGVVLESLKIFFLRVLKTARFVLIVSDLDEADSASWKRERKKNV